MQTKNTLRKYLLNRRVELYERLDELKSKLLSNNFTERDILNLEVVEAQLNEVKTIIEICVNRGNKW